VDRRAVRHGRYRRADAIGPSGGPTAWPIAAARDRPRPRLAPARCLFPATSLPLAANPRIRARACSSVIARLGNGSELTVLLTTPLPREAERPPLAIASRTSTPTGIVALDTPRRCSPALWPANWVEIPRAFEGSVSSSAHLLSGPRRSPAKTPLCRGRLPGNGVPLQARQHSGRGDRPPSHDLGLDRPLSSARESRTPPTTSTHEVYPANSLPVARLNLKRPMSNPLKSQSRYPAPRAPSRAGPAAPLLRAAAFPS